MTSERLRKNPAALRFALPSALMLFLLAGYFSGAVDYIRIKMTGGATISERLEEFGPAVDNRLRPVFVKANVPFPPSELTLVAFKRERRLDLYAPDEAGELTLVMSYEILGASGGLGPKLREGDGQVPEGIYEIDDLNPNSQYHLSLHVNYPNEFDRDMAKQDGRTKLGHSIFIHGGRSSIGCLAMGDPAAEELFVLVARLPNYRAKLIISPVDFRKNELPLTNDSPTWVIELYNQIHHTISELPDSSI